MKTKIRSLISVALALLLLSGCTASPETEQNIIGDDYCNWYEIFVYSFCDSNGDGIGDLNGVTEKLDYVAGMGFNGIWLMPIMPSPSYHKYDVTDYYQVDPQYGSLEDMKALLSAAHERGMRVIIDLPVNHSSDKCPWFISAAAGEDSEYRDYYNWSDSAKSGYNISIDKIKMSAYNIIVRGRESRSVLFSPFGSHNIN